MRGWDDPRMPTISGAAAPRLPARGHPRLRARGRRGEGRQHRRDRACSSTRCATCSTARPCAAWRCCARSELVIENYPEGQVEELDAVNNPEDAVGRHPQGALLARALDRARRLHGGSAERSSSASLRAARCACATPTSSPATRSSRTRTARSSSCAARYDPATRGGDSPDGRKPKATLHWVSAAHAVPAEVRLYDHLFTRPDPGAERRPVRRPEPRLRDGACRAAWSSRASPSCALGETVQFERLGYFCSGPRLGARPPGLQPHAHAQGHLGQGAGARRARRLTLVGPGRREPDLTLPGAGATREPRECVDSRPMGKGAGTRPALGSCEWRNANLKARFLTWSG